MRNKVTSCYKKGRYKSWRLSSKLQLTSMQMAHESEMTNKSSATATFAGPSLCMTDTIRQRPCWMSWKHLASTLMIQAFKCTSHRKKEWRQQSNNESILGSSNQWYLRSIFVKCIFMKNTWSREFRQQLCPTLYSPIASVGTEKEEVSPGNRYKKRKWQLLESDKLLLHVFSHSGYRTSISVRPEKVFSPILMLLKQITSIFVWHLTGKIQISLDYGAQMSPSCSLFSPFITHLNIK